MIRITQIKMPLKAVHAASSSHIIEELIKKAAALLYINKNEICSCRIVKKSIDARKKPEIYFIYSIDVEILNEDEVLKRLSNRFSKRSNNVQISKAEENSYQFSTHIRADDSNRKLASGIVSPSDGISASDGLAMKNRPVIIGTGPAGLFCGYFLALYGYRPILLERGKSVENRRKDVEEFWKSGLLNTESNVQFGEGGAGTFSDGKLNTLIKDKSGRNKEVLRIFVHAGAPEEIMYEAKPHIGTDILMNVVKNMRNEIIEYGGEVRFESKVTDIVIEDGRLKEVIINDNEHLPTDAAVLAIGHSARDTFKMLHERGIPMDAKSFAVGLRVEHPREMINKIQYGIDNRADNNADDKMDYEKLLPAADYKLTAKAKDGRGVYSFCMCPGGYVVNASSEKGRLAVNGMSYSRRNGNNSNSAIIVTVAPDDYKSSHPLAGVEFQQELEAKAFKAGQGQVPVETYGEFKEAVTGDVADLSIIKQEYPDFVPEIKGAYRSAAVHQILPDMLNKAFIEGMEQFGKTIPGFADSGVYVSGVESRTSSPVRIHRDETGQSKIQGLYPCGEGAGYAGGITSAAMDGIAAAEKIASMYRALD